jgi:predicted O-methyltransferase YrrM
MRDAPVELLQHEGEFTALLELYRERAPMRTLEIGSWAGGSLFYWLSDAPANARVVSIDLYDTHDNAHLYGEWASESVEVLVIRGNSTDPGVQRTAARYGPYDWVFIDADHTELYVRADWLAYSKPAAPGAVIALHDVSPTPNPAIQVASFWAELERRYETRTIASPGGFGIGVVFMPGAAGAAAMGTR